MKREERPAWGTAQTKAWGREVGNTTCWTGGGGVGLGGSGGQTCHRWELKHRCACVPGASTCYLGAALVFSGPRTEQQALHGPRPVGRTLPGLHVGLSLHRRSLGMSRGYFS